VLTPSFRYHPAIVAQAFATLGDLFPGRIILGVGSGEAMNEKPLGIHWPERKERFARLKEAVDVIQTLWREDRVDYDGTHYRTEKATIYDKPEHPVPIYIAGAGPAATRLAGRVADGWITTSGKGREFYENLIPALDEGIEKAGRAADDVERLLEIKVSFDPDRDRAMANTHFWGALALTPDEKTGVEDPVEMQRLADALPVERTASRFIVSSDVEEHVERIREYLDLGFTHLVFHAPGPDQERFLRLYGEEILPALRTA
jgi:coenzyme F420-dependent glucose-6-phosphate dehydrogenase